MGEQPRRLFKDYLDAAAVARLAAVVTQAWPGFERATFERAATTGLETLELSGRVAHVAGALQANLPRDFGEIAAILDRVAVLWPKPDAGNLAGGGDGFGIWPVFLVVPATGLHDFDRGMELLRRLTPLFSAEGVIRPFIHRYGAQAFERLERWLDDPDEHVRRLVSEGTRPRLPWASRVPFLSAEPRAGLRLLDRLVDDPSLYVRRSVANHLNDVSRDHPALAIEAARRWLAATTPNRRWVVRHALRSLIKAGHAEVFELLGHTPAPGFSEASLTLSPTVVPWGGTLTLSGQVLVVEAGHWVMDWAICFAGAPGTGSGSGQRQVRRKVFKGRQVRVEAAQVQPVHARYDFRPITTRRYYPGEHAAELLINGQLAARAVFSLEGVAERDLGSTVLDGMRPP